MEQLLRVGVITTTHGIRGEVKVFPTTDDIHRFDDLEEVILQNKKEQVDLPALFAVNYIFSSLYAFLPSISVQVYSPFFSDFSNLPE